MSAFDWYRKPGISREKANETVHQGRNVSEKKKKVKPSKELLSFLSFTETTENFLYHCCTWITNARPPPERKRKIYLFFFFSSRRMPIVLGTFTSSSTKFVDLSYHAWTL